MGPGAVGIGASQPPKVNNQAIGGGLSGASEIPSLGFDIASSKPGVNSGASDAYVPTFSVGGASRRPRRTLG